MNMIKAHTKTVSTTRITTKTITATTITTTSTIINTILARGNRNEAKRNEKYKRKEKQCLCAAAEPNSAGIPQCIQPHAEDSCAAPLMQSRVRSAGCLAGGPRPRCARLTYLHLPHSLSLPSLSSLHSLRLAFLARSEVECDTG